jgi:hypothetical protein
LIEEEGYYMKIRPDKFSMDFNDSQEYSQSRVVASSNYPTTYLDLFSKPGATSPETRISDTGRLVYLLIYKSNRNYDAGWKENIYEVTLRSKKLRYFRRMV